MGPPNIDILLLSRPRAKELEGLPSWVPEWSAVNLAIPHGYRSGFVPMFSSGYRPGESVTLAEADISTTGRNIIRVKGVLLAEICQVGTHFMDTAISSLWHGRTTQEEQIVGLKDPTILPRTIFSFFREVRTFCRMATAYQHPPPAVEVATSSKTSPSTRQQDQIVWLVTTGGHGLTLTDKRSLLGPAVSTSHHGDGDSTPPLGCLWDLQMRMDVLPSILQKRKNSLISIAAIWPASNTKMISNLREFMLYLSRRAIIEAVNLYWLQKNFLSWPFFPAKSEDFLYYGVFGTGGLEKDEPGSKQLGLLKTVLERHIRRRCFLATTSGGQHIVGLGPMDMKVGDKAVVLLGASAPVILRQEPRPDARWVYVGEAYCHGFMHGEALKDGGKKNQ